MYRDLGFIRVWGTQSEGPADAGGTGGAAYAYLIYPHRAIIAYLAQTHRLLNEYCVAFPDETRPYGSARLPDSDDVLAKWMALTGDEHRLISTANMHLPGRQLDPARVKRDLWRLAQWERARMRYVAGGETSTPLDTAAADAGSAGSTCERHRAEPGTSRARRYSSRPRWAPPRTSISSAAAAPSPRDRSGPRHARS